MTNGELAELEQLEAEYKTGRPKKRLVELRKKAKQASTSGAPAQEAPPAPAFMDIVGDDDNDTDNDTDDGGAWKTPDSVEVFAGMEIPTPEEAKEIGKEIEKAEEEAFQLEEHIRHMGEQIAQQRAEEKEAAQASGERYKESSEVRAMRREQRKAKAERDEAKKKATELKPQFVSVALSAKGTQFYAALLAGTGPMLETAITGESPRQDWVITQQEQTELKVALKAFLGEMDFEFTPGQALAIAAIGPIFIRTLPAILTAAAKLINPPKEK